LEDQLDIQVIIGDPWSRVYYPPEMKPVLRELGPKLAVAVGLAMREIE
jgi:Tfp pilus assembly PilM family ATPase